MPPTPTTTITITDSRPTKTGKNLSIQDQNGNWYCTKAWDLANHIGQTIEAHITQQTFPDGGSIDWINDYNFAGGPAPAHAVDPHVTGHAAPPAGYAQARPQQPAPPLPPLPGERWTPPPAPTPTAQVDRDASIVAQALCKTVTFSKPSDAWAAYKSFYQRYMEWKVRHNQPKPVAAPPPPPPPVAAPDPVQPPGPTFQDDAEFDDDIPF